jgi:hypothetical protein
VNKLDKWVLHGLNENQTNCRYEAFSGLLLRKKKNKKQKQNVASLNCGM